MRIVAVLALLLASACTSNPTPHPANDAGGTRDQNAVGDTSPPNEDYGPDDDNDGVPDCLELNGAWDGDQCNVSTAVPDADAVSADGVMQVDGDATPTDGEDRDFTAD